MASAWPVSLQKGTAYAVLLISTSEKNKMDFERRETPRTLAQILALYGESLQKWRVTTAWLCFNDFKKTFSCIHRGRMMKIHKAYDVLLNLLRVIGTMYKSQSNDACCKETPSLDDWRHRWRASLKTTQRKHTQMYLQLRLQIRFINDCFEKGP